jgi:hypothetical protein
LNAPASGNASTGRNLAILLGNYDYITFLDSDDEYYPEKVAEQVEAMQKPALPTPLPYGFNGITVMPLHTEVDVCISQIELKKPDGTARVTGSILELFYPYAPNLVYTNEEFHSWTSIVPGMFRKHVFELLGGFQLFRAGEDSELKDKILALGMNVKWLEKPLYRYYQDSVDSLSAEAVDAYQKDKKKHLEYEQKKREMRFTQDYQDFINKFHVEINVDHISISDITNLHLLSFNQEIPCTNSTEEMLKKSIEQASPMYLR